MIFYFIAYRTAVVEKELKLFHIKKKIIFQMLRMNREYYSQHDNLDFIIVSNESY